jgi:tetratricopeptide (TPR) repeat protein
LDRLLYSNWGKLDEAEKMYQRALQGKEKALGPKHTSTLSTVNNLGNLYADQGKMDEAEEMCQRALQGYEKVLGRERVKTYTHFLRQRLQHLNPAEAIFDTSLRKSFRVR